MSSTDSWRPAPFKYLLFGHLFTGGILGFGVFLIAALECWLAGLSQHISSVMFLVIASATAKEFILAIFDWWYGRRRQHPDPGGWLPIAVEMSVTFISYSLFSLFFLKTVSLTLIVLVAVIIIVSIYLAGIKPWRAGMTSEEVRNACAETVRMTQRVCKEDQSK